MAGDPGEKRGVVLVVEDEALLLWHALDIVTDAGFEGVGAANADEAIRILQSRDDIRLVFTDINMPGSMDGMKLAHAVHDLWPSIQIIVTSAFRAPNGARLPDGGQFFQKPYQSSQITQAIREMVA